MNDLNVITLTGEIASDIRTGTTKNKEELQENGDINKLQKRIEDLEKELKWWQDRYNELYKNYLELLSCPRQKYRPYQPIWINKTHSSNTFSFVL